MVVIFGDLFSDLDAIGSSDAADVIEVGSVHFLVGIRHGDFLFVGVGLGSLMCRCPPNSI